MLQRFSCIFFLFKPPWVLESVQNEHALIYVFSLNVKFPESLLLFIRGKLVTSKIDCGAKFRRIHVFLHSQAENRL